MAEHSQTRLTMTVQEDIKYLEYLTEFSNSSLHIIIMTRGKWSNSFDISPKTKQNNKIP